MQRLLLIGCCFVFLSVSTCHKVSPHVASVSAFDDYYGIYVNGQKVGWMRSRLQHAQNTLLSTELHAKITGIGQVSEVGIEESRTYDLRGDLLHIDFKQSSSTGQVRVVGQRQPGDIMRLDVLAGGAKSQQNVAVQERLTDMLSARTVAQKAVVGTKLSAQHFDPSLQKMVTVEHRVEAVEPHLLGGVEVQAVQLMTYYPDLHIEEQSWLDSTGKTLEANMGSFFVARLEPPEVAKQLDYSQDLLISAVVAAPWHISDILKVKTLTLHMTGFGADPPPASSRQHVQKIGDQVKLTLQQDKIPPKIPWPEELPANDTLLTTALAPTPFIQSDAPEIKQATQRVLQDTNDVFAASTKLVHFVYRHIHSEYVPAFSNALEAYHSARGDCTEHSVLFVAMARAANIPSREVVGVAYWAPGHGFGWHAWAEVSIAGQWVAVDPTWDQPIADATHVKLADGGAAEQARIVMLLGRLKITDMTVE